MNEKIFRIIDANLNRLTEGIRVCEEITRFILEEKKITQQFRKVRHRINSAVNLLPVDKVRLLKARDILKDVGKISIKPELKREDWQDIFFANISRIKESVRVLEEFSKLFRRRAALDFKKIRYSIYEIEKKTTKRILSLCDHR